MIATARAQSQLRHAFVFTATLALVQPAVLVARAAEKFDGEERLTDEATRQHVRRLLNALAEWTKRLKR